jgi:exodeoxyribonuclease VII small subunit
MTDTPPGEPTGYAEALAELERILADLDRDTVDVDVLANQVARASSLISFCRDRIASARLQVDHVLLDNQA